jgi:glutathione synthase
MDPLHALLIEKDTTIKLIFEGIARGHDISIFHVDDVFIRNRAICGLIKAVHINNNSLEVAAGSQKPLTDYDVLLMRKDPPFDMAFATACLMLSAIEGDIKTVNSPTGILLSPEKLWPATFDDITPPTLISSNREIIASFKAEYGAIVIKPLYKYCGRGIYVSEENDRNLNSVIDYYLECEGLPLVAQKYLPGVSDGDRRIILLGGKPVGAINRMRQKGDFRCNMFVGGVPNLHMLSETERSICSLIGPWLLERGLHFVGIDVIDGLLTEINTTAPTGIMQFMDVGGVNLAPLFWNYVETEL